MQTLNLIRPEESNIKYEIIHFPDGEVHIKLGEFSRKDKVEVKCRITNAEDLFILIQLGDIFERHAVDWGLKIYYLMSARMDRVISFNESYSLRVVTDIISQAKPQWIHLVHPHSRKSLELLDADDLFPLFPFHGVKNLYDYQICFPDKGAVERYYQHFSRYGIPLVGKKVRNIDTGKIESIIIENSDDYVGKPILVIDDLCDAGGTFIGIAEAIRSFAPDAKLNISVFHMVNRKGIENLSKTYDEVIFTNSYKDWDNLPNNCQMIKVC